MHPIVIMTYDKSPAITKAVSALEEAGLEVRVLNTAHAKLADFLGALAGEEDEDEDQHQDAEADLKPSKDDEPKEGLKAEPKSEKSDEATDDELADLFSESLVCKVNGEDLTVILTEGPSELVPNGLMVGSKTAYMVNESHFAFWPVNIGDGMFDLTHQVQVQFGDKAVYEDVKIEQPATKAFLRLNKETYAKFQAGE